MEALYKCQLSYISWLASQRFHERKNMILLQIKAKISVKQLLKLLVIIMVLAQLFA